MGEPKARKKSKKKVKPAEDILDGIGQIVNAVEVQFRFQPEYYKAMTCRILDYLQKERPDIFTQEK